MTSDRYEWLSDRYVVIYTRKSMPHSSQAVDTRREAERIADLLRADPFVKPGSVEVWLISELAEAGR